MLPRSMRDRLLEVAGVKGLTTESSGYDVTAAVNVMARFAYGMYIGDQALLYAAVVNHLEDAGLAVTPDIEERFFDRILQEVIVHGQVTARQGRTVREDHRALAHETAGEGREAPDRRAPEWEPRGRKGVTVELGDDGGASEASAESEPVEGDAGSGRRRRPALPW